MPWFVAGAASPRRASGVAASGELWSLPALGAVAVAAGLALAARPRVRRAAGVIALSAGLLAALWAARNTLDPPVRLVAAERGGPAVVVADDIARVRADSAAFAAIGASATCCAAGLLALLRSTRA
jgi:hypothetical protein